MTDEVAVPEVSQEAITAMYVELDNLVLDDEVERERIILALNNLNTSFDGRGFEEIYGAAEFHMQNVLGVRAKYEHYLLDIKTSEKRVRGRIDVDASEMANPATGKPYARDAINALVENHEEVIEVVDQRLIAEAVINYMKYLHELYILHYDRIININVNARRAWDAQG